MKRTVLADGGLVLNIFHSMCHARFAYFNLSSPTFVSGFPNKSCFVFLQRNFVPDTEVTFPPKF